MRIIKTLLSVMLCLFVFTSCTEKETVVNYGFVCSDNLFKFVNITATYTTSSGEHETVELTPSAMEALREDGASDETSGSSSSTSVAILQWRQSKHYDDSVEAQLTIAFSKKPGIDYSTYKGQIMKITKNAYLQSQYKEEGWNSSTVTSTIDLSAILTQPDEFYGDYLEEYIDKLVANPIIK